MKMVERETAYVIANTVPPTRFIDEVHFTKESTQVMLACEAGCD